MFSEVMEIYFEFNRKFAPKLAVMQRHDGLIKYTIYSVNLCSKNVAKKNNLYEKKLLLSRVVFMY